MEYSKGCSLRQPFFLLIYKQPGSQFLDNEKN